MAGERKLISVVMPTYERRDSLRRALQALGQQTMESRDFEVVVAVDGSRDGTEEMLRCLHTPFRLRFTTQEHRGTAAARNLAVRFAEGRILVSLDDDIVAHPGLLATHVASHRESRGAVVLGQIPLHPEVALSSFARYRHRRFEVHYRKMNRPDYAPDFRDCLTGNLSLGREALLAAGGFDGEFREFNHEDTELGYRLVGLGMRLRYEPKAIGYHLYVKSFGDGCRDSYGDGRSSVMMIRKHPQVGKYLPAGRPALDSPVDWPIRVFNRAVPTGLERLLPFLSAGKRAIEASGSAAMLRVYFSLAMRLCYWRGVADERRGISL